MIARKGLRKKFLWVSILLSVLSFMNPVSIADCKAQSSVAVGEKAPLIRLKLSNKPISYALKKIADKASINILIPETFDDQRITLYIQEKPVSEALSLLMERGNFTLVDNNGVYVVTPIEKPVYTTEVIPLNHANAAKVSSSLIEIVDLSDEETISIEPDSNSLVVKAIPQTLDVIKSVLQELDLPKTTMTYELKHNSPSYLYNIFNSSVFKGNNKAVSSDSKDSEASLEPIYADNETLVIKGIIKKEEQAVLQADAPVIIPDDSTKLITVIGNPQQQELIEYIITYYESKNSPKGLDSTVKDFDTKVEEFEKVETKLNKMEIKLADTVIQNLSTNMDLENAKEEIATLIKENQALKSEKAWSLLTGNTPTPRIEQPTETLSSEIDTLKKDIAAYKTLIEEKTSQTAALESQLATKNKEIMVLSQQLDAYSRQLDSMSSSITTEPSAFQETGLLITALERKDEELQATKTELNRVKKQFEISKDQLELIFGGKLLESTVMPNDKSRWFD